MKHMWLWWKKQDIEIEMRQCRDEGRDTRALETECQRLLACETTDAPAWQMAVSAFFERSVALPVRADFAYREPSDVAGIRSERPEGPRAYETRIPSAVARDRVHGAWLGRCAGCLLGKPIEGAHRPALRALLERRGLDAIPDYLWRLPDLTAAECEAAGLKNIWPMRATREMPEDDDTNYTVAGMALMRAKGLGFTPEDVADFWLLNLPIGHVCTAERIAYRNFVNEIPPPLSAVTRNPYREWIGAQIRADFFGYVALGRPELAAELAWRDACVSHVKNGIYGAMWVAAMLAAAAVENDARRVVEIGLSEVPERSRFAEALRETLAWRAAGVSYDDAVERLHARWDETNPHDWCHAISNAQIVALGLLYGDGDFELTITRAVQPCFDTDCNGATAGSVVGMMLGAKALPEKWTAIMRDTVQTGIAGYHRQRISALARTMFDLYRLHRK
jgi:ADP-ribosylglycohydrolase